MLDALTFLFDTVINVMMVPGKVENWVFIMELIGLGLTSLPVSLMKNLMSFLSTNFRSRLHTMYIVNTPSSIFIPWSIAKGLLEENTVKKINFIKTGIPEKLFELAARDQVEQRHGGTYPDRTVFWPVKLPRFDGRLMDLTPAKPILPTLSEETKTNNSDIIAVLTPRRRELVTKKTVDDLDLWEIMEEPTKQTVFVSRGMSPSRSRYDNIHLSRSMNISAGPKSSPGPNTRFNFATGTNLLGMREVDES
eukprot:TRINITY_DN7439_c0_g1_i10.p1 TRINITY_DN7439_c0_g1~~TRINITY_DN7439_c0_g1_i10.p1  ORF type:complete len:250 (-),score=35.20 TRINITY_DN7439_c0_g1_i10:119-868(-)